MSKLTRIGISLAFLVAIGLGFYLYVSHAAQGDYATLGYDSINGRDLWRVNSSGYFVPGAANTYDIGSSALTVGNLYMAGTLTQGGATALGGALSVSGASTLSAAVNIAGQLTIGAAATKSTFTTAGYLSIPGNLTTSLGVSAATATFSAGILRISTASASADYMCIVGVVAALPTSGFQRGCLAYLTSDNGLYVSTETVASADSWKIVW